MKKLTSLLLTLMMILGLSTTALAADTVTLTIEDPYAASEISLFAGRSTPSREYEGYKLLNLTMGLKEGEHHSAHDGAHTDDCYNFAYTVNDVDADGNGTATGYRAILQEEVYNHAGDTFWGSERKPASYDLVTDEQILDYLESLTGDSGDVYGSLRIVADRLYRAIKTATPAISADASDMDGIDDIIVQGYWLIADVTGLDGHEANSLVMLDTRGQSDINVTPKTAIPEVEKKVKDIEDSEDSNILDNAWQDSADHDLNDTVPFKLTATLPSNAQYYTSYQMVFHDTLSAGLTLKPETIKVLMYDTKYKADVDTDLNDFAQDVTDKFTSTTSGLTDGCTFEVSCNNVYTIAGVTKTTAFVVYYEATLNGNAVMGSAGNPNEVVLEFSNDPYSNGTGKTSPDKVVVFTYQVKINKKDSHGHNLDGAGFKLYKKDLKSNTYELIGEEKTGGTSFTWTHLDDGDYKLEESIVPAGYNKMDDITFTISASHSETAAEPELVSLDGGLMGTGEVSTGMIEEDIVNHTGVVLPETGAKGTAMLIGGSAMFVVVAAVFMVTRKKMSVYAD